MKIYDATQEFKPFERKEGVASSNSHARPRKGATAKKKAKLNK